MKLIILILANDNSIYLEMQKLWKTYMNNHNNITSYFIKYNSDLNDDIIIENDTIFIKGYESLIPGCLDKTIKSIEFLMESNIEFDFIFRTNLSSVVDLNKLYNLLNNNIEAAGIIGNYNNNINFISGAGILINKKICKLLINNKNNLNYNSLQDDILIGWFLTRVHNINITPLIRLEAYNYEDNIDLITNDLIKDYYHFRCKSINSINIMKKIISIIYYVNI